MLPATLLQMAGAPASPASLGEAVLVLIDAQLEYTRGRLPLVGIEQALENCAALLRAARNSGTPILHIVHRGGSGGLFDPAGDGFAIADDVQPRDSERVIEKTLPNGFAKTDLATALQATGRSQLILAGFMTHMCVSATARAALDHGYRSTVIADACATRALPDPLGGSQIAAIDLHRAALAALSDRFAVVARTADIA